MFGFFLGDVLKRQNFKYLILVLFIGLIVLSCEIKDPASHQLFVPTLSSLTAPESVFLQSETEFTVSVKVIDPQGWQNINLVQAFLFSSQSSDPLTQTLLADDGETGDIIPRDGLFFGRIQTASFNNLEGVYNLSVVAQDIEENFSDTLSMSITVYADEKNQPPILSQSTVSDTMTVPLLFNAFFSVQAQDPQGLTNIDTVKFAIYLPYGVVPYFEGILEDDGQNGDLASNDGWFSFHKNLSDTLQVGGLHTIRFQAFDKGGLFSNVIVQNFVVDRANDPPVILQITAPDTVARNPGSIFPMHAEVNDSQSLADIKIVHFIVTKPDGTSNGIPLQMFDNGQIEGDKHADDGIYTLTVIIEPHNDLGTYQFDFTAKDLSGAVSETVTHFITVVDQVQ